MLLVSCPTHSENFMKSHSPSVMWIKNTDPDNKKGNCVPKEVNATYLKSSRVPRVTSGLSWRFHENQFIYFFMMLLTDITPCLVWGLWNIIDVKQFSQLFCWVVCNKYWKFRENPLSCFSVMLLATTYPENRKSILFNESFHTLLPISLNYISTRAIDNQLTLFQVMAWPRTCDKPLT